MQTKEQIEIIEGLIEASKQLLEYTSGWAEEIPKGEQLINYLKSLIKKEPIDDGYDEPEFYIPSIKDKLDIYMHELCRLYLKDKSDWKFSPRWFNYGGFDFDTKVLTIKSTQISAFQFNIQTNFRWCHCDRFWPEFKKYRTEFLKEHYPTIKTY